jgi:HEAT repeat protein
VRASALRALRELRSKQALLPALKALSDTDAEVRVEAVSTIGYLRLEETLLALIAAANDADPRVRRAAIGAIVFAASDPVAAAIARGLDDSDWTVREAAAEAIGALAPGATAGERLTASLDDPFWQVRLKATRSLGKLKVRQAAQKIALQLRHQEVNLRKESAAALGEIADPATAPLLEAATHDADPDVRKTARWGLSQMQR